MALLRVDALVLRNLRMGDTSRIVTVLSRELGKWSGVAKGVRDPKSRFGASLEILNHSSLVVYYRHGRALQLVSEGFLEHEYLGLLRDPARYVHGCAVCEFLDRVLEEESPVPETHDLALRVLSLMEEAPRQRLGFILRAFQLRVAAWLGLAPRLDACVSCSEASAPLLFNIAEGNLTCERCAERGAGGPSLDAESLALLRSVSSGSLPRNPGREASRKLEQVVEAFLTYHLGRYQGLRSLRCLADGFADPPPVRSS